MQNSQPILLVDDDSVEFMTAERVFKDLKVTNQLVRAGNGAEALQYLKTDGNEKPCMILLDLNMPKMNGIEFLKIAKADEALRDIPVVMLTTSKTARDVAESFKLGAAGYMTKSVDYIKFVETVKTINLYWTLSESPNRG
jgi:CheY-like chemotaxis protein